MRHNTTETCTDSSGASEASTSEAIAHFLFIHNFHTNAANYIENKHTELEWTELRRLIRLHNSAQVVNILTFKLIFNTPHPLEPCPSSQHKQISGDF